MPYIAMSGVAPSAPGSSSHRNPDVLENEKPEVWCATEAVLSCFGARELIMYATIARGVECSSIVEMVRATSLPATLRRPLISDSDEIESSPVSVKETSTASLRSPVSSSKRAITAARSSSSESIPSAPLWPSPDTGSAVLSTTSTSSECRGHTLAAHCGSHALGFRARIVSDSDAGPNAERRHLAICPGSRRSRTGAALPCVTSGSCSVTPLRPWDCLAEERASQYAFDTMDASSPSAWKSGAVLKSKQLLGSDAEAS
mmetsp:Transcript_3223/g.6968  ORF Transcript_3223/g.6968 Transcript_3223/m.6968 type:complete len:259 (-) Transcript_3223:1299-2075(-)